MKTWVAVLIISVAIYTTTELFIWAITGSGILYK